MRSNAVISPMPLHTEERGRGRRGCPDITADAWVLDVALRVSPAGHYSNTHRHYRVHETRYWTHTCSNAMAHCGLLKVKKQGASRVGCNHFAKLRICIQSFAHTLTLITLQLLGKLSTTQGVCKKKAWDELKSTLCTQNRVVHYINTLRSRPCPNAAGKFGLQLSALP